VTARPGAEPSPIAVAIVCKTPEAGYSKTRLSPPLAPAECAALSACFIRDLAATIGSLADGGDVTPCALYTPVGSEARLAPLLPAGMRLVPQRGDGFGDRLLFGMEDLLADHAGAILVNSDSPTLPASILRAAVEALRAAPSGDTVVLSPAVDGGYTLIGLATLHRALFDEIPWSTADVHRLTVERAREIGVPVVDVPGWYDVDDAGSLAMLEGECLGGRAPFPMHPGAEAAATRAFLLARG
jgi:rSAM/selenodomain-associated transferase 1